MRHFVRTLGLATALVSGGAPLLAQGLVPIGPPARPAPPERSAPEQHGREILFGLSGVVGLPTGEFNQFIDAGGGFNMYGVFNLDAEGTFGVRVDGAVLFYGHERTFQPLTPQVGVHVTTSNFITSLGIGPQLTFGDGPFRPYVFGTVGFSYFATVSSLDDGSDLSTTNFDDLTGRFVGGVGILVELSRGRRPVSLDFGLQSVHNGEAEYLRRGSIRTAPNGSIYFRPTRSQANLLEMRFGITIGLL